MALELAMAQQQVAKERKARLQSMLLSEAVQYDKELAFIEEQHRSAAPPPLGPLGGGGPPMISGRR